MAISPPRQRNVWADQNPLALQTIVDASITVIDDDFDERWALPAGWVEIVNRLHVGLSGLLQEYSIVRVTNKMSYLRYAIDRHRNDHGPDVIEQVWELLAVAKAESLRTCALCGGPALGTISRGTTRCEAHPADRALTYPAARARPPGYWARAGA